MIHSNLQIMSRRLSCRDAKALLSCQLRSEVRQYSASHRSMARSSLKSDSTNFLISWSTVFRTLAPCTCVATDRRFRAQGSNGCEAPTAEISAFCRNIGTFPEGPLTVDSSSKKAQTFCHVMAALTHQEVFCSLLHNRSAPGSVIRAGRIT